MKNYIEYIDLECKDLKDNSITRQYRKKLIDEMTARANEMTHAGMKDQKVITDLLIDEFPDLKGNYANFAKEEKKRIRSKKFRAVFPIAVSIFLIAVFALYFYLSFTTGEWAKTWLIITGGIIPVVEFCLILAVKKLCLKRGFYSPVARITLATAIMLVSVYAFLPCLVLLSGKFVAWPLILGGAALSLIADLCFAYMTKQKFRTISFFVYMPIIAALVYVILAVYGVLTWSTGWLVILLGVVADLVYLLSMSLNNMKYIFYSEEDA